MECTLISNATALIEKHEVCINEDYVNFLTNSKIKLLFYKIINLIS